MVLYNRQASIRSRLMLRASVIDVVRRFFNKNGYLEVDTPIRLPTQAPETNIDAVKSKDWMLQTSPELCMKRLLASGYQRIFQICRCFRDQERGRRHLPEMTLLEWYTAGDSYHQMMNQTETLIKYVAEVLKMKDRLSYQGQSVVLKGPWQRVSVADAFDQFGGITVKEALATGRFDDVLAEKIEPCLGVKRPTFLMDYPVELGALARKSPTNPGVAERFELYIGGVELCNGFSELTDTKDQRDRFEKENRARVTAGKPPYPLPEPFLAVLEEMPPAAGNAMGLDRLVMLLADTSNIDDIVAFVPEEL